MSEKLNRKEFFHHLLKSAVDAGVEILEKTPIFKKLDSLADPSSKEAKQRPPGSSMTDMQFLEKCTGCDACMAACPVHVIVIDDLERRDPVIYPEKNPCIKCPGFPCISACPTGALSLENGIRLRSVT